MPGAWEAGTASPRTTRRSPRFPPLNTIALASARATTPKSTKTVLSYVSDREPLQRVGEWRRAAWTPPMKTRVSTNCFARPGMSPLGTPRPSMTEVSRSRSPTTGMQPPGTSRTAPLGVWTPGTQTAHSRRSVSAVLPRRSTGRSGGAMPRLPCACSDAGAHGCHQPSAAQGTAGNFVHQGHSPCSAAMRATGHPRRASTRSGRGLEDARRRLAPRARTAAARGQRARGGVDRPAAAALTHNARLCVECQQWAHIHYTMLLRLYHAPILAAYRVSRPTIRDSPKGARCPC